MEVQEVTAKFEEKKREYEEGDQEDSPPEEMMTGKVDPI